MMTRLPSMIPLMILSLFALGCPTNGTETDLDTDIDVVCDPVGSQPEMNALLNADLESDVEVIQKTPRHPGEPGPEDLP